MSHKDSLIDGRALRGAFRRCFVTDVGVTIVEVLIAMSLALCVMASTLTMVSGLQRGFAGEGERADMQQRVRVASDALYKDLLMAGAGAYQGTLSGPLDFFVAAVMPFRQGAIGADPPGTFKSNTLTVVHLSPAAAPQTTIRQPLPAQSSSALLNADVGCPLNDPACGLAAGMDVMVYDETGSYDTFRITRVQGGMLELQHTMVDTPQWYAAGAKIAAAASHTYYPKADKATDTYQLMHYDGVASDVAVVDHLVGLTFEYFGEPFPPVLLKPVTDPAGPWTTYGPRPPPPNVQSTAYPAGENCAFQLDAGNRHVSRLTVLGNGSTTLVRLTALQLTDGPWCPDDANPHRYDADLLRIRRIAVTFRVESALAALRGPAGVLFSRGGTSAAADRWLPDREIRLDVAPRNLNAGR
jgi:hypothetical protein